jgi:hypothetical protein
VRYAESNSISILYRAVSQQRSFPAAPPQQAAPATHIAQGSAVLGKATGPKISYNFYCWWIATWHIVSRTETLSARTMRDGCHSRVLFTEKEDRYSASVRLWCRMCEFTHMLDSYTVIGLLNPQVSPARIITFLQTGKGKVILKRYTAVYQTAVCGWHSARTIPRGRGATGEVQRPKCGQLAASQIQWRSGQFWPVSEGWAVGDIS